MTRILVVDDDPQLLRALRINLAACGTRYTALDGHTALRAAAHHRPDIIVLDLGRPDLGGIEVLAGLQSWCPAQVIVLSARTDAADKVAALDTGADDYVTKPFGMDEFLARIRAAARRATTVPTPSAPTVETAAFTVDLAAQKVTRDGIDVHLTPTEWGILEMLVGRRGTLVGHRELLTELWGPSYVNQSHYLRVYLAQLRRKLEPDPAHPRYLITEPGRGYRFEP